MEENNGGYLGLIIIFFLALFFFSYKDQNKECRSHDSFALVCHHNDSNTDIYLRRINKKLDKVVEYIESKLNVYNAEEAIRERTFKSYIILSAVLDQLKLLNSGKVHTGFWVDVVPNFLRNQESKAFDECEDYIVIKLTEEYDYTREEASILRVSLPKRRDGDHLIRSGILMKIKSSLRDVIRRLLMEAIIEKNDHKSLPDLSTLIERYRSNENLKIKKIIDAIGQGSIHDMDELSTYIKKIYL